MAQANRQSRPLLFLDPDMEFISVAKLRLLTRKGLKELRHPLIVNGDSRPAAIILSYEQYLRFQELWIEAARQAQLGH